MATKGANFVRVVNSTVSGSGILVGSTVLTGNQVAALDPLSALAAVNSANPTSNGMPSRPGVCLDRVTYDLSLLSAPGVGTVFQCLGDYVGVYALNGSVDITLTGTTPALLDLTLLSTASGATSALAAGDVTFAKVNCLIFNNKGATDLVLAPGGSNPANFPKFTGTTPTIAIPAGGHFCIDVTAGVTVDATHKILSITPTAGGVISVSVGGA